MSEGGAGLRSTTDFVGALMMETVRLHPSSSPAHSCPCCLPSLAGLEPNVLLHQRHARCGAQDGGAFIRRCACLLSESASKPLLLLTGRCTHRCARSYSIPTWCCGMLPSAGARHPWKRYRVDVMHACKLLPPSASSVPARGLQVRAMARFKSILIHVSCALAPATANLYSLANIIRRCSPMGKTKSAFL